MTRSDVARRLPFGVALAVVLGLLALGVATSQLAASRAGDDVLQETAPFLTDEGLATMRADIVTIDAVLGQMAADPTFRSKVEGDPVLSAAALRLPEVRASAEKVVGNLE
uniref:hypothetical protein n=1 Tax=Nocardioides stalactiti TaxID=2755356 RepID=UPI00160118FC